MGAPAVPGGLREAAAAVHDATAVGKKAPITFIRWSFGTLGFVALLAFVYLAVFRPAPREVVATSGDWITPRDLEDRDRKLSPATEAAVQGLRSAIESLRVELERRDARASEDRRATLDAIGRVETKTDRAHERLDRIYEAIAKPPK